MNEIIAKKIVDTVFDGLDKLCISASIVRENCDSTVFDEYQLKIATIVADAGDSILEPIFREHPKLRP